MVFLFGHLSYIKQQQHTRVISQVGSGERDAYAALALFCEGKETISDRPSAQVKHIKVKKSSK